MSSKAQCKVYISLAAIEALRQAAHDQRTTKSAIVEDALHAFLGAGRFESGRVAALRAGRPDPESAADIPAVVFRRQGGQP